MEEEEALEPGGNAGGKEELADMSINMKIRPEAPSPADEGKGGLTDIGLGIRYEEDGVYVELSPALCREGVPCQELVRHELSRKGVEGSQTDLLEESIRKYRGAFKIAEPQTEKDRDSGSFVFLGKDKMTAYLLLLPPAGTGRDRDVEEIQREIQETWGIRHGLDHQAVAGCVLDRCYYQKTPIAQGTSPRQGRDGQILLHFKQEHSGAPVLLPDGTVDYKNLDTFAKAAPGDVLATKIPPEEGEPGYTVIGETLPGKRGKEVPLPKGVNVQLSEDGESLVASIGGRVDYSGGTIRVSDVLQIFGDADMGVGNINFHGDVVIHGDVIANLSIRAEGDIEIHGSVSAAILEARGNIVVRNGVVGTDRGSIKAGGNVTARFIERATVDAGGSVQSDYIVNCNVDAGESVVVRGRKGKIIGGVIRAGKEVIAQTIGSSFNDQTVIEVGIRPEKRSLLEELEEERRQVQQQLSRIEYVTRLNPVGKNEPKERTEKRRKLLEGRESLLARVSELSENIEKFQRQIAQLEQGKVHVIKEAYKGVRIDINSCSYILNTFCEYTTFKCSRGEVALGPLEI